MNTKIKSWLDKLPNKKRSVALKIRGIFLDADPEIKEEVKWGNITFSKSRNHIGWILNYTTTDYLNLGFFKGAKLSDPKKLLEGTGKGIRHQKIRKENDIDKKQITKWIKEAENLSKSRTK